MHGLAALGDRLIRAVEGLFEFILCFSLRKQIVHYLKPEHQPLKTLQQRVMQIAREAGSLADAFVQAHVEFARDLMEPVPVQPPEQCQKSDGAQTPGTSGLIIRRGDGEIEGCAGLVPHAAVIAGHHAEAVIAWRKIVIERLPFDCRRPSSRDRGLPA